MKAQGVSNSVARCEFDLKFIQTCFSTNFGYIQRTFHAIFNQPSHISTNVRITQHAFHTTPVFEQKRGHPLRFHIMKPLGLLYYKEAKKITKTLQNERHKELTGQRQDHARSDI